jgi:hypothetical protein
MPTNSKAPQKPAPVDPVVALEQRFAYRVQMYLANSRGIDAEFTLPGLRGWMLCQKWPDPPPSATLECLAVLSWSAICRVNSDPDDEDAIRSELGRQFDYLTGQSSRKPASLDGLLSPKGRRSAYDSLREASAPGSSSRESLGLPRFNAADKRP